MNEDLIRSHLSHALTGFAAHLPFSRAVEGFPGERAGEKVTGLEHSMWMLVEHLRIVNRDFIEWVSGKNYTEKPFPSGYWPDGSPPTPDAWEVSVNAVNKDLEILTGWAEDRDYPLWEPLEHQADHTPARELILAIAHNGYHIGQMVDLRALLGVPVKDW